MEVNQYSLNEIDDSLLKFAVIVSRYKDQWVYVKHKDRTTWEIPGGRREPFESIIETAHRELIEETGAINYHLKPVSIYGVTRQGESSYGILCLADIINFKEDLSHEISEVAYFDRPPSHLTYPEIQPYLQASVEKFLME